MPKPVCVPCQRFFRPEKNGYSWVEGMPKGCAPPGTLRPDLWSPYKLWHSDLWKCEGCGTEIIVGHCGLPIAEHYEDGFDDKVKAYNATLQVNDC